MSSGPRATTRTHDWIDERSLALARAVGAHLRQDPSLIQRAVARLERLEQDTIRRDDRRFLPVVQEWRALLTDLSLDDLIALLGDDRSERATRLRQSHPFVGVLPPEERDAIFRQFETQ